MLVLQDVVSGYGKHVVVQGVSIEVGQDIVTIIGANGSGKSTLLKSIVGQADVLSGQIRFDGYDITRSSTHEIATKGVGYVPQLANVFGALSVDENLDLGGYPHRARRDIKAAKNDVYSLFPELNRLHRKRANLLSGGERQMLAVGRALMGKPKMLLLDEPTAALSPKSINALHSRIKAVNKTGIPVLMVEQNVRGALAISDYTYLMASGRCVYEGPSRAIDAEEIGGLFLGEGTAQAGTHTSGA